MNEPVFRRLQLDDLDRLMEIEQASFSDPWSRESYHSELGSNKLARYWGVFDDGQMLGFCGLWQVLDEGHITNIAIHPDYRRRGLAEWLLRRIAVECLLEDCFFLTLEVRSQNEAALELYAKLGFESKGVRTNYYHNPDDHAVLMWWDLLAQS